MFDREPGPKPLVYLASPYSNPSYDVRVARYARICFIAGQLIKEGHHIFCPIAMSHPIQEFAGTCGSWEFWEEYDTAILLRCDELWVVTMPGWDESVGVQAEIKIAWDHGIKVRYIDANTYERSNHL